MLQLTALSSAGARSPAYIEVGAVADYRSYMNLVYSADGSNAGYFAVSQFSPTGASTTERMRIDNYGNVGIGTSSPAFKLQIAGANSSTGGINITGSGTNGLRLFQDGSTGDSYINNFQNGFMAFSTNNTERMRLDASGNLGLGVTPSAWQSTTKSIDISSGGAIYAGSVNIGLIANGYYNSAGTATYKGSTFANAYIPNFANNGSHVWYNAPSGTAGNAISFTQAMNLTAGGLLGIGQTSPVANLDIKDNVSDNASIGLQTGTSQKFYITAGISGVSGNIFSIGRNSGGTTPDLALSGGNLLVGTTSASSYPQAVTWQNGNSADGFCTDWNGVSSVAINLSTLFPSLSLISGSTVSVDLQIVTSSGSTSATAQNILAIKRGDQTWYFSTYANLTQGGTTITATGSGTTITLTFGSGGQYGVARVKVVSH
jgi:hypothetical protein